MKSLWPHAVIKRRWVRGTIHFKVRRGWRTGGLCRWVKTEARAWTAAAQRLRSLLQRRLRADEHSQ